MASQRSLGIDVGIAHLHFVCLQPPCDLVEIGRIRRTELADLVGHFRPGVVAVDSPSEPARQGSQRFAEHELSRLGIQSYRTPGDPDRLERPFYAWMREGFEVFRELARLGYPRYARGPVRAHAVEIFPYAAAVALTGALRPTDLSKRAWRRGILGKMRFDLSLLRNLDLVDAALAALTGLRALDGEFTAVGDPVEGVVVLPVRTLPPSRYRRPPTPSALGVESRGGETRPDVGEVIRSAPAGR